MHYILVISVRGEGVCPVRTFFGQGGKGLFRCGRPHFLVQKPKTSDFSKFIVFPHGQGGLNQCGHFSDKRGGGSFFRNFMQTSFIDGLFTVLRINIVAMVVQGAMSQQMLVPTTLVTQIC